MSLVEKELHNGVLIKIYSNGELSQETKQTINNVCSKIRLFEIKGMKIVFDYEEQGSINIFNEFAGKKPILVIGVNQIYNLIEICQSFENSRKALSYIQTDIDYEVLMSLINYKLNI